MFISQFAVRYLARKPTSTVATIKEFNEASVAVKKLYTTSVHLAVISSNLL